jgi:cytochrome c oxidase accessory protein FixG
VIAILIGHTAMAYLIGIEKVKEIVMQSPAENMSGFIGLVAFSFIFYGVFAYLREQACIVICPYGRLQGVLLVKDSMAVMYDWIRGEPRGKIKKNEVQADKGDCIDCKLCVHVCPTGIDIRNGTQLECVNCTACIDVCDDVMTKIDKPKGLIKISSYNAIAEGKKKLFTTRVAGYTGVLVVLITLLTVFVATRSDIQATILRVPGMLYQRLDDDQIQNLYNIQLINKTTGEMTINIKLMESVGTIEVVGGHTITIAASSKADAVFYVRFPEAELKGNKNQIILGIYQGETLIDEVKSNFLGPFKINSL